MPWRRRRRSPPGISAWRKSASGRPTRTWPSACVAIASCKSTARGKRFAMRLELREQRGLDALPGLVVGPEVVAERLDDVIGRHTDVSRSGLDHLQYRMQHAADGAEALILALAEMAPAVKLAEQLVRTVDEMNDHAAASGRRSRSGLRQPAHSRRR